MTKSEIKQQAIAILTENIEIELYLGDPAAGGQFLESGIDFNTGFVTQVLKQVFHDIDAL